MRWKGRSLLAALFVVGVFPAQALAQSPDKIALCEACHGPAGNSAIANTPSIAAQPLTFLENQLVFMREGMRNAPVMQAVLKGVKDEDLTALARHFSAQKARVVATAPADPALVARGTELSTRLHCDQCHLPSFAGRDQMPRIAGQREDYMVEAMVGYRDGKRSAADTTMTEVLTGVSDADIRALAHYLSRLGP